MRGKRKRGIDDLALLGGTPLFVQPVHVGRPNIGNRRALQRRFKRILDSGWLTNRGPFVREFEETLQKFTGARHCIAVCNGTIGLELSVRALGLVGEVIVPAFTFVATVHVLQWLGITPVFCDVDPATHTLDPERVADLITPRTSGIMAVHLWGQPCQIERLTAIAGKSGLKLLFDAAHAFGCSYSGKMIGNFGDAEVYSFHATKLVNTFEGGAIVTNNDELAEHLRLMKNFGFSGYDQVDLLGINGKMNEFSAAMGITSLESMPEFVTVCRRNYRLYRERLAALPGVRLLAFDEREQNTYQYVVLELEESEYGLNRDQVVQILHAENVLVRRYFYPGCHRMEPYRRLFPDVGARLPVTERLCRRVLTLPTGTTVSPGMIEKICELFEFLQQQAPAIRQRLG